LRLSIFHPQIAMNPSNPGSKVRESSLLQGRLDVFKVKSNNNCIIELPGSVNCPGSSPTAEIKDCLWGRGEVVYGRPAKETYNRQMRPGVEINKASCRLQWISHCGMMPFDSTQILGFRVILHRFHLGSSNSNGETTVRRKGWVLGLTWSSWPFGFAYLRPSPQALTL